MEATTTYQSGKEIVGRTLGASAGLNRLDYPADERMLYFVRVGIRIRGSKWSGDPVPVPLQGFALSRKDPSG